MNQDTKQRRATKPGSRLITSGLVVLALGVIVLLMNLMNPVSHYVTGVGMIETRGPSAGSIVLIVLGLILGAIGFCRRLLAAVENR